MDKIKKICKALEKINQPRKERLEEFVKVYRDLLSLIPSHLLEEMKPICITKNDDDLTIDFTPKNYNLWKTLSKEQKVTTKLIPIQDILDKISEQLMEKFTSEDLDKKEMETEEILTIIDLLHEEVKTKKK